MKHLLPYPHLLLLALISLSPLLLVAPVVVYAQWEPEQRLTFNPDSSCLSNNNARCLAVSGDTVHVVWFDRRDGNWEIYYKRSTDAGATWGPDIRLTTDSGSSQNPSIAVSGSTIHLVWQDYRNGNWEIYYKNSTDGGVVWSPDTRLTADTMESGTPCIADWGSTLHLVWADNRTGSNKIYYKRSTDGGASWSSDLCLTSGLSGNHNYPCIASAGNLACLAYQRGYQDVYYYWSVLFKRSLDGGVNWSADTALAVGGWGIWNDYSHMNPSIALIGSSVYLVWRFLYNNQRYPYTNWTTINYSSSQDGGSSWSPYVALTRGYFWTSTYSSPSIWANSAVIRAVWTTPLYSPAEVIYCPSTDRGISWCPQTRLTFYGAVNPSFASFGPKVHVIWQDNRNGNYEIYYRGSDTLCSDLDIYNDSLDLRGNQMDFGTVCIGQPSPAMRFAVVNADYAHNPDPDGPSLDTLLTNVLPVRARLWGPDSAYFDAIVNIPLVLRQGVVQVGTVSLNVPGRTPLGFYQGSVVVSGSGKEATADTFRVYVTVGAFADLDVDNDSLDLKGNLMDFGRVAAGSPAQVRSFQLLNTNWVKNPDPDGPSLDTLLTDVHPVTVTLSSSSNARLDVVVNVPPSLRQGYTEAGTVTLLVPGSQPLGVYWGTIVIQGTGRDTFDRASDSFSVRVEVRPIQELTQFAVAPNPFIPKQGHTTVCFYGLPSDAVIRIYDLSGLLVKELPKDPGESFVVWDPLHNPKVASGVYFFCVFSGKKTIHRGKLAVIK
jgi:hypothetical protein